MNWRDITDKLNKADLKQITKRLGFKLALMTASVTLMTTGLFVIYTAFGSENILGQTQVALVLVLLGIVVAIAQTVGVLIFAKHLIERPTKEFVAHMKQAGDGILLPRDQVQHSLEFKQLRQAFNGMLKNLSLLQQSRKSIEERLIKAEENLKFKHTLEEKANIIERMNQELTSAFNDISLLYTVSQQFGTALEYKDLIQTIGDVFSNRFACDGFYLYLVESNQKSLKLVSRKRSSQTNALFATKVGVGEGIIGRSYLKKCNFYLREDLTQDSENLELFSSGQCGSVYVTPIVVRDAVIGVLAITRDKESRFSSTDRQSIESIANQIGVSFERAQLYSKTKELAIRDELTGAYNRRHFQQVLRIEGKRALRTGRPLSLAILDVDYFKQYNDTLGHLRGDDLLKRLSQLIGNNIREEDLFARFGGEEFVILLPETSAEDAVKVAEKLRALVCEKFKEDIFMGPTKEKRSVSISIGVASFPEHAQDGQELIRNADTALYRAKKDGRNCCSVYDENDKSVLQVLAS